jgi:DNA-binding CsgD family transcriptional regulator
MNCGTFVANELMDDRVYIGWVEHCERLSRQQGALAAVRVAVLGSGFHHVRTGHFAAAETSMAEASELTIAMGDIDKGGDVYQIYHQPLNATLLAWRGDDNGTRASAKSLIEKGQAVGSGSISLYGHRALAILELGAGRYEAALVEAERVTNEEVTGWRSQLLPIVVEAGVRSGNRDAADRALAELRVRATATATPWALGLLARGQALLADDADAELFYVESISQLEHTLIATDLALAHLSYGEWLRRQRRRVDARRPLRAAYDMLASMGAAGFAERARVELLATGEHAARRTVERQIHLTPQELQIATLASKGATNPEIATKLFLSASTVDYHLRKVFRKLDITRRRQLEQALTSP